MAWCPVCRNEYREGITECADCHVPLVEELPPEEGSGRDVFDGDFEKWVKAHPEMLQKIKEDQEAARKAAEIPVEEAGNSAEESRKPKVYRSNAERAEEFKSSAWTLVLVGTAGLAAMVLIMLGVIPLHFAANVKYLSYGVMTVLFAAFIVIGIRSFDSAKKYAKAAGKETELTEEIHSWFMEEFGKEGTDSGLASDDGAEGSEAELYFRRIEKIRRKITSKYTELDEAYLNKIADDFFHEIYE